MDDSPSDILSFFAPYATKYPVIKISRDALNKEIKSTTSIYAEWAQLVLKAMYPTSAGAVGPGGNLSRSASMDAVATSTPQTQDIPKRLPIADALIKLEAELNERGAARAQQLALEGNLKLETVRGKQYSREEVPFLVGSSTHHDWDHVEVQVMLDFLASWIDGAPSDVDYLGVETCDFGSILLGKQANRVADDGDPDESLASSLGRVIASDGDKAAGPGGEDSGPIEASIFNMITQVNKTSLSAPTAELIQLLEMDEEIQIIDPEELTRPSQADQERAILDADSKLLMNAYRSAIKADTQPIWKRAHDFRDLLLLLDAERHTLHTVLTERLPELVSHDDVWAEVTKAYKNKKKSSNPETLAEIDKTMHQFVDIAVQGVYSMASGIFTESCKDALAFSKQFTGRCLEFIKSLDTSHQGPVLDDEAVTRHLDAISEETLNREGRAKKALFELVAEIEALAPTIKKVWDESFPTNASVTVNMKLIRGAKSDYRKRMKQFQHKVSHVRAAMLQALETVVPWGSLMVLVHNIMVPLMVHGAIKEQQAVKDVNDEFQEAFDAVCDRRDATYDLYDDGIDAGIRCLDLSLRNVLLDEMSQLAAAEHTREKENELFGAESDSKKKGKTKKKTNKQGRSTTPTTKGSAPPVIKEAPSKAANKQQESADFTSSPCQEQVTSSSSIDGVERVIPQDVLDLMGSPGLNKKKKKQQKKTSQADSKSAPPKSSIGPPTAEQPNFAADNCPGGTDGVQEHTPAATGDNVVHEDNGMEQQAQPEEAKQEQASPSNGSPTNGLPIDLAQLSTEQLHQTIQHLFFENSQLRTVVANLHGDYTRVDSAARHMMAEHTRLMSQRTKEQAEWQSTEQQLLERIALLEADVRTLRAQAEANPSPPRQINRPQSTLSYEGRAVARPQRQEGHRFDRWGAAGSSQPRVTVETWSGMHGSKHLVTEESEVPRSPLGRTPRPTRCLNCFVRGHESSNCPSACRLCAQPGHSPESCPTSRL